MTDQSGSGKGQDYFSCYEEVAACLQSSADHLRAVQRVIDDVQIGCEESRDRSVETVAIVDRFFEAEPDAFLQEIRGKMQEMILDGSRSRHRAEFERLIERTY